MQRQSCAHKERLNAIVRWFFFLPTTWQNRLLNFSTVFLSLNKLYIRCFFFLSIDWSLKNYIGIFVIVVCQMEHSASLLSSSTTSITMHEIYQKKKKNTQSTWYASLVKLKISFMINDEKTKVWPKIFVKKTWIRTFSSLLVIGLTPLGIDHAPFKCMHKHTEIGLSRIPQWIENGKLKTKKKKKKSFSNLRNSFRFENIIIIIFNDCGNIRKHEICSFSCTKNQIHNQTLENHVFSCLISRVSLVFIPNGVKSFVAPQMFQTEKVSELIEWNVRMHFVT